MVSLPARAMTDLDPNASGPPNGGTGQVALSVGVGYKYR